jgi:hypothetical protein
LVPIYRRPQAPGHHGAHLASFLFLLVTTLKLNVLEFSMAMF